MDGKKKKIIAAIPASGGNKGIPKKYLITLYVNIDLLSGKLIRTSG